MSQRRIRERGGGLLIREKAHRRGGVYLKGKLPREGGFVNHQGGSTLKREACQRGVRRRRAY